MTNTFTASNGDTIETRTYGGLNIKSGTHTEWVHPVTVEALREYFTAERDAELGRERDAINSDLVVYPKGDDQVCVIDESACTIWDFTRSYALDALDDPGRLGAASRYFEQHPGPAPEWHDAKPGEAWVLTVNGREYAAVAYALDDGDTNFATWAHNGLSCTAPGITAGRRIWPTGGDDE